MFFLLLCLGMGFVASVLQFSAGLHNSYGSTLAGDDFFSSLTGLTGALGELGAVTNFSVAAAEPKVLIVRNWLGKITMSSRLQSRSDLGPDSYPVVSNLPDFGTMGMPKLVDLFADEKHANTTRQLWEKWVEFVGTSPDLRFLSNWAQSLELMTMGEAQNADPFSPHCLFGECQLPVAQVAQVLGIEQHQVRERAGGVGKARGLAPIPDTMQLQENPASGAELLPEIAPPGVARPEEVRLSMESIRKLTALRCEFFNQQSGSALPLPTEKSDDVVLHKTLKFHNQHMDMLYAARGKPDEQQRPKLKTRAIATDHWVCLSERYFRHGGVGGAGQWLHQELGTAHFDEKERSFWELLRSCYARVTGPVSSAADATVQICEPSAAMVRFLRDCPCKPQGSTLTRLPKSCLEPYIPARGKAGALSFAVRLLSSRRVLGDAKESLFAIFDARHMPYKKFWYDVLPAFFHPGEHVAQVWRLNRDISFAQTPQRFAKLPTSNDFLDFQNAFFFNCMNQLRNNAGAVTSCGTNAVWLLPKAHTLPHMGEGGDGGWWENLFFEEQTKIEDTATSHRLISEGRHSVYVNPENAHGDNHPACVGVAKEGPNYLAAVERWCEGAVQLFWVTLRRGPSRDRLLGVMAYVSMWWLFIITLLTKPLTFCDESMKIGKEFCHPLIKAYLEHDLRTYGFNNELWPQTALPAYLQILENCVYSFAFLLLNFAVAQFFDKARLARTFVVFDNLTSFTNAPTLFYWVSLNVYMLLGFESPFRYNAFDLTIWFFLQTLVRWSLMYSAKMQGNVGELSIWRTQQAALINAPNQVFAMFQGTKAAYDIMRHEVDKSWWIDPVGAVRKISKSWTLFLVAMGPLGAVYIVCSALFGVMPQWQQIISLLLTFIMGFEMLWPMCYIWGWTKTINRLDGLLIKCTPDIGKAKGIFTVLIRVFGDLIIPVVLILVMSPSVLGQSVCSSKHP